MDQAIKLFGRTIPFSQTHEISTTSYPDKSQFMDSSIDITIAEVKSHYSENSKEQDKLPTKSKHNIETEVHPKSKKEQLESSISSDQEKTFKKPDKILSCPRCNSFDTKFCYFNNYNVNQPRHFCKKCQRYWTAGGTVRNVPIGAGRRKNKHLASQFHLITASTNGVSQTGFESTNSSNQQLLSCGESSSNGNVTVLRFGPEVPLCDDSTATRVSSYQKSKRCLKMQSVNSSENGHESSYRSPLTKALTTQENESSQCVTKAKHFGLQGPCNETRTFNPLHYCPVPPLVIPWNNPTGNNVTSCGGASHCYHQNFVPNGSGLNQVQCYPLQFVSTGHWGSIPMCAARPGNIPLIGSFACFSPSSTSNGGYSGNGSPTLGKHCRDANFIDEEKLENCVWVPKVLRTDDTDEA